jgi:hypothetical protein
MNITDIKNKPKLDPEAERKSKFFQTAVKVFK